MAINITTNLVNTTGGKLSEVSAIQGSWQTVDTLADMNAFTASNAVKQNLKNGQIFYISSSGDFYKTTVTGAGLGATYSFDIYYLKTAESLTKYTLENYFDKQKNLSHFWYSMDILLESFLGSSSLLWYLLHFLFFFLVQKGAV